MLNKFLVFGLLCSMGLFAKQSFEGRAKFISDSEDNLSFVKSQLLYTAFLNVADKAIQEYGLDNKTFWDNYNESLKESLDSFEASAIKAYKEKVVKGKEVDYSKELRKRKLNFKRKFGNVQSLIQSYSVKSMTRSSNNPNYRFLRVRAKVNKDNLSKFYYRFMSSKSSSLVDSLYINVDFNNKLFNYSEIGVAKEADFTSVIEDNWKAWFIKHSSANMRNIELISVDEATKIERIASSRDKESFPSQYLNSLYLKVEVNMKLLAFNTELNKYSFEFQVSGLLIDIKTNKTIKTFSEKELEKTYENIEIEKFSSIIANHLYRMPMSDFSILIRSFKDLRQLENTFSLVIRNYKNLNQVNRLRASLDRVGIKYSLQSSLDKISSGVAALNISLNGSLVELKTLLNRMKRGKKDQVSEIVEISKGLSIKLK